MGKQRVWSCTCALALMGGAATSPCAGAGRDDDPTVRTAFVAWAPHADQPEQPKRGPADPSLSAQGKVGTTAFPRQPRVRLADTGGETGGDELARAMSFRIDQLAKRIEATTEPNLRIELRLATANLILSHQLEPLCTRRLVHLADDAAPEADQRDALLRVDELLSRSDAELQDLAQEELSLPEGWLAVTSKRHQTIRAFATGLSAYLHPGMGQENAKRTKQAAYGLAPLLEDRNRTVAASAALWQACLRSTGDDVSRAIAGLEAALSDPVPESLPFAFFGRLLRCRLLADQGAYAAAISLLMQIEEQCVEWMPDAVDQANAMRTAQLTRFQIMAEWYEHLPEQGADAERAWCIDRAAALLRESFDQEVSTICRLGMAVPIVAPEPPMPEGNPDSASEGG